MAKKSKVEANERRKRTAAKYAATPPLSLPLPLPLT